MYSIKCCIRKERSQINNLSFYPKKPEKEKEIIFKVNTGKKIIGKNPQKRKQKNNRQKSMKLKADS